MTSISRTKSRRPSSPLAATARDTTSIPIVGSRWHRFHGTQRVQHGALRGRTYTDYFVFDCPGCNLPFHCGAGIRLIGRGRSSHWPRPIPASSTCSWDGPCWAIPPCRSCPRRRVRPPASTGHPGGASPLGRREDGDDLPVLERASALRSRLGERGFGFLGFRLPAEGITVAKATSSVAVSVKSSFFVGFITSCQCRSSARRAQAASGRRDSSEGFPEEFGLSKSRTTSYPCGHRWSDTSCSVRSWTNSWKRKRGRLHLTPRSSRPGIRTTRPHSLEISR